MSPEKTWSGPLERIDGYRWRVPKSYRHDMRVDGIIYADDLLMSHIRKDQAVEQVANVATLPGIQGASLAMPDIHWGYGFCIGGVAATDPEEGGVISPGGVGYDINCGVRLLRSDMTVGEVRPVLEKLVNKLFENVPCGVGKSGKIRFTRNELKRLMVDGSRYVVGKDLGWLEDIEATEAGGALEGADPDRLSDRAIERGHDQCGTLGSGNHFLEIQVVDQVFDAQAAEVMGLAKDMITIMIHSGSRGLGYQVCDDSLLALRKAPAKYGISLPDRQLVCAPVHSPEGEAYLGAMRAAANFAWCNRQILTHLARKTLAEFFSKSAKTLGLQMIYDVAHNIAKIETYTTGGKQRTLCVHRKGATRAFPPGHPEVPEQYRQIGQPVLIPGDMGRASYVLVGQPAVMEETFGSTCHGAGRLLSRTAAVKAAQGRSIAKELAAAGIVARARGWSGLAEEQPAAYKDVDDVVHVVHEAGLSKKVCRLKPIGVIKG
jgi:tRNA-splicing ligase RtcB